MLSEDVVNSVGQGVEIADAGGVDERPRFSRMNLCLSCFGKDVNHN